MNPRTRSTQFHSGAPAISRHSRTPGYRIVGRGFGAQPGQVLVEYANDGKTESLGIESWFDTII